MLRFVATGYYYPQLNGLVTSDDCYALRELSTATRWHHQQQHVTSPDHLVNCHAQPTTDQYTVTPSIQMSTCSGTNAPPSLALSDLGLHPVPGHSQSQLRQQQQPQFPQLMRMNSGRCSPPAMLPPFSNNTNAFETLK